MVIYHRVSKGCLLLLMVLLSASCRNSNENRVKKFDSLEVKKVRAMSIKKGTEILGEATYWSIYQRMNDSLQSWISAELDDYKGWNQYFNLQIDSVLCVNSNGDKLIAMILKPNKVRCEIDGVTYLYGVKIRGTWFYFRGPGLLLPHEFYKMEDYKPFTHAEMRTIVTGECYFGYLTESNGRSKINENYFNDLTSQAWCTTCHNQADWDSTYLSIVRENWVKRKK